MTKTVTPLRGAGPQGIAEFDPLLAGAEEEERERELQAADDEQSRMA